MSDFYNKYPYTDFHELNLDWVIERVKKLTDDWLATHEEWVGVQQDWADTEQAWIDFKAYVENYLANLDVQDEIDHKIDQMVANGTLRTIIQPDVLSQTISTTTEWLAAHITQPTTPAIDTSLTIAGAAADAKKTGDLLKAENGWVGDYTTTHNYIDPTTGAESYTDSYRVTSFIPVSEGDICHCITRASTSALMIAMYVTNGGNADTAKSIRGTNKAEDFYFTIPSGINYIRCVYQATFESSFNIFINGAYNIYNKINRDDILYYQTGKQKAQDLSWASVSAYISANDGSTQSGNYSYSNMIPVVPGQMITFVANSSISTLAIGCYANQSDVNANVSKSVYGIGTNAVRSFIIPSGINFIRVCVSNTYKPDCYVNITIPSINMIAQEVDQIKKVFNASDYLLQKRKASVSFSFDDGNSNDNQIKLIFDDHDKKCGFAVYDPIHYRYTEYDREGFEILAHAVAPIPTPTEALERAQMAAAKADVVAAVGHCYGWVTPSSALADEYKPLVYDYFEYGYTVYKGDVVTPADQGMDKTIKTYGLWRASLQVLTLAEQKAILDYAVANNVFVAFYGHAGTLNTDNNLTTANLNALLTYCDTIGIDVLTPRESMQRYMAFRHNEDA